MSAGKLQQLLAERSNDGGLEPASGPVALAPRVRQLRDCWESKRRGRLLPARADIDPAEIKPLLSCLIIADLLADPLRVRFRLAGTKVCEAFGFNVAGRWLEELDLSADVRFWLAQYERLIATQAPVYGRTVGMQGPLELFRSDWAMFPLSSDGQRVDQSLEIEDWAKGNPMARFDDGTISWRAIAFE
jgi:PAS domain